MGKFVNYLSDKLLALGRDTLVHPHQRLITAGGFAGAQQDHAYSLRSVNGNQVVCYEPTLHSSHEEGDSRVGLHAS